MSQILINDYLRQLDVIKKASGSQRETIVREAFKNLLKNWGKQQGLIFLAEYPLKTATKTNIAVDGALLHELRMPLGYWEAKDANDDLDTEVTKKLKKGYPQDNIIFSDDAVAVLWQNRNEVLRCDMTDTVLDQYKEKKPKDPTIREKFDTYRFADYKEKVIDLLARVTTVSVETMKVVNELRLAAR